MVASGQKTTIPEKPAEKPEFGCLGATNDFNVKDYNYINSRQPETAQVRSRAQRPNALILAIA